MKHDQLTQLVYELTDWTNGAAKDFERIFLKLDQIEDRIDNLRNVVDGLDGAVDQLEHAGDARPDTKKEPT